MSVRDKLVDLYYALVVRPDFRIPPETLAKTVTLRRTRACLLSKRINLVIDVGANVGQYVRQVRRLGYRGRIVSFEPDPRAFAALVRAYASDPLWRGYPVALGDEDTERTFRFASDSRLNSFLDPRADIAISACVPVDVRRLDAMFDELVRDVAEPRVFLKLDTQGYDLKVLDGAARSLRHVDLMLSEVSVIPIYEQMTPYYDALRRFSELGFTVIDLAEVSRDAAGQVIEFDCLLERVRRA